MFSEDLDKSLFFAIKRGEAALALQLYQRGANLHAIYQQEKGQFISSLNMFIRNFSRLAHSKGPSISQYRQAFQFLSSFLGKISLQCKCPKEHKCPLFFALEAFKIGCQQDILQCKSDILRAMIVNGATIRFEQQQNKKADRKLGKWNLRWLDIQGLRSYLITKRFSLVATTCEC